MGTFRLRDRYYDDGYKIRSTERFDANVDHKTTKDFKVNKTNAYDPTINIRQGKFFSDTITCEVALTPKQFMDLKDFIINAEKLYIEFDIANLTVEGGGGDGMVEYCLFDIDIKEFPKMTDNGRFYPEKYTFEFKSVYTNRLLYVDPTFWLGYGSEYGTCYGYT